MEFLPATLLSLVLGFFVFVPFTAIFRKLTQPTKTWLSCLLDALLELPSLFKLGKFAKDNDIHHALATAMKETGHTEMSFLEDEGDVSFVSRYVETRRVGLEKLQISYSPSGYLMVQEMLHRRMSTRLRFIHYLNAHPAVAQTRIKDPIFVIGFPRTGTTFLHELLGLHPGVRMHYTWEQIDPVPHTYINDAAADADADTGAGAGTADSKAKSKSKSKAAPKAKPTATATATATAAATAAQARDPAELALLQKDRHARFDGYSTRFKVITSLLGEHVQAIHRIGYTEPEECTTPCSMELPWAIPELLFHIAAAKETLHTGCGGAFAYYRKYLQLLTWQNPYNHVMSLPGDTASTGVSEEACDQWMLKCPFHLPYLDGLMQEFPSSTIVWTHRDPVECIASACSLYETLAALCIEVPTLDRIRMGQAVLEYTYIALTLAGTAIKKELARQEKSKQGKGGVKILHIRYADNVKDPVSVCRDILRQAGMSDGSPQAVAHNKEWEERVTLYLEKNAREREAKKRGSSAALHSYCLEDYGLTEAGVREKFKEYTDLYDLVQAKTKTKK